VLKGEDIVLLLKLVDAPADWTVRTLAEETTIPRSGVHRAIKRLSTARLFNEHQRRVNISQCEEFLIHGLRYVFPSQLEGPSLGVPTAWAAEPLASRIVPPRGEFPPVWPYALGKHRGLALAPLHASAVGAARNDPALGERLALVDALRIGDARVKGVAGELLSPRLVPTQRQHRAA
jgi:hypothetical protein